MTFSLLAERQPKCLYARHASMEPPSLHIAKTRCDLLRHIFTLPNPTGKNHLAEWPGRKGTRHLPVEYRVPMGHRIGPRYRALRKVRFVDITEGMLRIGMTKQPPEMGSGHLSAMVQDICPRTSSWFKHPAHICVQKGQLSRISFLARSSQAGGNRKGLLDRFAENHEEHP
jgi:hypothetical protein